MKIKCSAQYLAHAVGTQQRNGTVIYHDHFSIFVFICNHKLTGRETAGQQTQVAYQSVYRVYLLLEKMIKLLFWSCASGSGSLSQPLERESCFTVWGFSVYGEICLLPWRRTIPTACGVFLDGKLGMKLYHPRLSSKEKESQSIRRAEFHYCEGKYRISGLP